ncbi:MAG: TetR/AcrR family transcriptional regulator [Acidimicrobiia bacterium]
MSYKAEPSNGSAVGAAADVDKIMTVARALLAANGYDGVKVPSIVAKAGISTRTFYRSFESKSHLLLALYKAESQGIADRVAGAVAMHDDPLDALDAWITALVLPPLNPKLRKRALRFAVVRVELIAEFGVVDPFDDHPVMGSLRSIVERGIAAGVFAPDSGETAVAMIHNLCTGTLYDALGREPGSVHDATARVIAAARLILRAQSA